MNNTESLFISRQDVATNSVFGEENQLETSEVATLSTDSLGEVSLIRKKTPYVDNVSDMMLLPLDRRVSQITEMNQDEGGELLLLSSDILELSSKKVEGRKFISINQQIECDQIPDKFGEDGTELKVQTINELHPHIFILPKELEKTWNLTELEEEDYHDFYDEFALGVSEFLYSELKSNFLKRSLYGSEIDFQSSKYPLGIIMNIPFSNTPKSWGGIFEVMKDFQEDFANKYYQFYQKLYNQDGTLKSRKDRYIEFSPLVQQSSITDLGKRSLLKMFVASREKELENRKYLRFIQGPALTWLIEIKEGSVMINPSLRFVSRGNAMESLGIWVDQDYKRQDVHRNEQLQFYDYLISNLPQYRPQKGKIYNFISDNVDK